jgi:hypothetical protein
MRVLVLSGAGVCCLLVAGGLGAYVQSKKSDLNQSIGMAKIVTVVSQDDSGCTADIELRDEHQDKRINVAGVSFPGWKTCQVADEVEVIYLGGPAEPSSIRREGVPELRALRRRTNILFAVYMLLGTTGMLVLLVSLVVAVQHRKKSPPPPEAAATATLSPPEEGS